MDAVLTGRDAAQALRVYSALARGRFDGRKVARDVLTVQGRARLTASLTIGRRWMRMVVKPLRFSRPQVRRTRRAQSASQRRSGGGGSDPSIAAPRLSGRASARPAWMHDG